MGFQAYWTSNDSRPTVSNQVLHQNHPMYALSNYFVDVVARTEQLSFGPVLEISGQAHTAHSGTSQQRSHTVVVALPMVISGYTRGQ